MTLSEVRFEREYQALQPLLRRCELDVQRLLRKALGRVNSGHLIRARLDTPRVKSLPSVERKAAAREWTWDDVVAKMSDLVGFRIVANNLEDLPRVQAAVLQSPL